MTKDVPKTAIRAINPMLERLCGSSATTSGKRQTQRMPRKPSDSDWAIHPGGAAILEGAKQTLQLTDDHIRASLDVYKNYGNSSSASVLIVLDKMRGMGRGRDNVVATSFGPGMMIEMCLMKRYRDTGVASIPKFTSARRSGLLIRFRSRLANWFRWSTKTQVIVGVDLEKGSINS